MSYVYNNGDGLSVLDKTLPNGAVEPVSILDDALKQVKAYLVDPIAGVTKIQADLTLSVGTTVPALDTRLTAAEAAITALQADDVAGTAALAALQATVDGLVVTAGGAPATFIITASTAQSVTSAAGATVVNFDTKNIDAQNGFNVATHTFVAPIGGLYSVVFSLDLSTTASSTPTAIQHTLGIYINGTLGAEAVFNGGSDTSRRVIMMERLFQLSATNTVVLKYTCTTGSGTMTSTIANSPIGTVLQGARLST